MLGVKVSGILVESRRHMTVYTLSECIIYRDLLSMADWSYCEGIAALSFLL